MDRKRTELQRLLSKRGVASRSVAAKLILEGKVRVNGKVVKDPRAYIPVDSKVSVDGQVTRELGQDSRIVIALHKPKGYVTTKSDEKGRKTVYDLLPDEYKHLKAIGRLDMATTGLLLFTNDNNFADELLDPKNKIERSYVVTVKGDPSDAAIARMRKGISDSGELLKASKIDVRKVSGKESILIITLVEGKNRELRRMCEAIGHEVLKLKRISFGSYHLGDLESGACRLQRGMN